MVGGVAAVVLPAIALLWWFDPFRVRLRAALAARRRASRRCARCRSPCRTISTKSSTNANYVSKFARSGVTGVVDLYTRGYLESDAVVSERLAAPAPDTCTPAKRLPHIVMVFDEGSFDITRDARRQGLAGLQRSLPLVRRQVARAAGRGRGRAELVHRIQRADRALGALVRALRRFRHPHRRRPRRARPAARAAPLRLQDLQPLSDVGLVRRRARSSRPPPASSTSSTPGTSAPSGIEPDSFYYDAAARADGARARRAAAVPVRLHGGEPLSVELPLPARADAGLARHRQSASRSTNICAARR